MSRIRQLAAVTACVRATAGTGLSLARQNSEPDDRHGDREAYTVALFGDMPYGAAGRTEYPRLLANVQVFSARKPAR